MIKEEIEKRFTKSDKLIVSELINELRPKLNITESQFMGLLHRIPETSIWGSDTNGVYLSRINIPESLKEQDILIKYFELIKQMTYISDELQEFLKGKRFLIQWNVTDLKRVYWLELSNCAFEYGKGEINNPSNIITTVESVLIDYIEGKILHPYLETQGKKDNLILFEEFCSKIFFKGEHPLGYDIDRRLYEVALLRRYYEKEEEKRKKEKVLRKEQFLKAQTDLRRKREEKKEFYTKLVNEIENLTDIYDEIKIGDIEKKLPHSINNFKNILKMDIVAILEKMIIKKEIKARIRGEYLSFTKRAVDVTREIAEPSHLPVTILRGGGWKIEGNQSIFNFKVKVKNNSKVVVTNVQILLTSIPSGLTVESDRYRIEALFPDSFESPTFKFTATDSCVGDFIKGVVLFTDYKGNPHTLSMNPFKIEYVCNLLLPKSITKENYEKNTAIMEEKKIVFDCELTPDMLESEVSKILEHNNFYVLENPQAKENPDFKTIQAYAEGKYDNQDVALSVIMQKLTDHTNKLIIKAMSNKQEKIVDLLKDISEKCDHLKIFTGDSTPLEIICKNCHKMIVFTKTMKAKDFLICEYCGEEIELKIA